TKRPIVRGNRFPGGGCSRAGLRAENGAEVRGMVETTKTQGAGIGSVAETIARFRQRFLERIAAGQFELPMLPEVATRVMSATQDDNCDSKQLGAMAPRA